MKTKPLMLTAALALGTIATTGLLSEDVSAKKKGFEKCYGVSVAGKNDCGSKSGSHSCAGQSKVDGDKDEWIYLPKGACDKIVGGIAE